MKAFHCTAALASLILLLVNSCSKNGSDNPVAPTEDTCTITGKVVYLSAHPSKKYEHGQIFYTDTTMSLKGEGHDETIIIESNGIYTFPGLTKGTYTLTPQKNDILFGPPSIEITVNETFTKVDDFYGCNLPDDEFIIAGKIVDTDNIPLAGVCILLKGTTDHTCSNENGYYSFHGFSSGETYSVKPSKEGYEYTFSPESCEVTISDNITVCSFIGEYSGPALYSISGRVADFNGAGIYALVKMRDEFLNLRIFQTNSTGVYVFHGLKTGEYIIECMGDSINFDYRMESNPFVVIVNYGDISVPLIKTNNIYTSYSVRGRVVDTDDAGIPGIPVKVYCSGKVIPEFVTEAETDDGGFFSIEIAIYPDKTREFTFIPKKKDFTFSPENAAVTLQWIKGIKEGDDIIIPDFIGRDHTFITASDYFLLSAGTTWTYERTENDGEPFDHTVSIIGTITHNGTTYHQFSKRGPWRFSDFRIEGRDVYAFSGDDEILLLKFGVAPGTEWESGLEANVYPRKGTSLGAEAVETPAGVFENCARFESKITYGEDSYDSYKLWYASGVGLVKSDRTVVNYGEMIEHVKDELKSYDIP